MLPADGDHPVEETAEPLVGCTDTQANRLHGDAVDPLALQQCNESVERSLIRQFLRLLLLHIEWDERHVGPQAAAVQIIEIVERIEGDAFVVAVDGGGEEGIIARDLLALQAFLVD